jgi:uncharacterized Zn-binding protein involved in type VI secretion
MCPKVEPGPVPHVGGPVVVGEPTVLIGFLPAAREGDSLICVGPPDSVAKGDAKVLIGNKPAARLGDPTSHGGKITVGCPTVMIGESSQEEAQRASAENNSPLGQQCGPGDGPPDQSGAAAAAPAAPASATAALVEQQKGGVLSKIQASMDQLMKSKEFKAVSNFIQKAQLAVQLAQGVRPFFDGKNFYADANQPTQEVARTLADEVNRVKRNLAAQQEMARSGPRSRQAHSRSSSQGDGGS